MIEGQSQTPITEPIIVHADSPTRVSTGVGKNEVNRDVIASQSKVSVFLAELNKIANSSESLETLVRSCKEVICQFTGTDGLWMAQRDENEEFSNAFSLLDHDPNSAFDTVATNARKLMKLARRHRQIQAIHTSDVGLLLVAPVIDGREISALLIGRFSRQTPTQSEIELLIGATCQTVANWLAKQRCERAEVRLRSLNDVVVMCRELDRCSNLNSAAVVLVNQLKHLSGTQQVVFAVETSNSLPEVLAISDLDTIDPGFDGLKAIRIACNQALESGEIGVFPDRREQTSSDDQALQQYCRKLGHEACVALPLKKNASEVLGCLLIATTPSQLVKPTFVGYLTEVSQMLSGHLAVILKANRNLVDHAMSSLNEKLTARRSKIAAAVSLVMLAMMFVPWPYRVNCDCEIQPVSRRFVAAPHDGILRANLVENGDVVAAGQTIAMLDDRQLRIELAGLQAQLQGASKQRSAATARGSIAESQIAASEVSKLTAEIELVNNKLKNLEITSPISGVVVAGDLDKVEGAPVEMGQTLFEIGPLDRMLIEVAVPEEEITYVNTGMPIVVKLNAYPFETWSGNVSKIHPKSELLDSNSVFIAEVEIENDRQKIKPGMKGSARIKSGSYPIGWNLFHRPLEQLRYWTIW